MEKKFLTDNRSRVVRGVSGKLPTGSDIPRGSLVLSPDTPRVFMYQPTITLKGAAGSSVIMPFASWFDGLGVTLVQFKLEILRIIANDTALSLETSPFIETPPEKWVSIGHWEAGLGSNPFVIVTAVSDSASAAYGALFSRYIRWRVYSPPPGATWEICFRIKAMVGASFTQWPEVPRLV